MVERVAVHELIARWWFHYDEGRLARMEVVLDTTDSKPFSQR
jgi:hypothetical protein